MALPTSPNEPSGDANRRREAARGTDGRFGAQQRDEPRTTQLTEEPFSQREPRIRWIKGVEHVELTTAQGTPTVVPVGVITSEVEDVYKAGQCLALAVAANWATGWPIAVSEATTRTGEHLFGHCWVQDPDGQLLDISGYTSSDLDLEDGETLQFYSDPEFVWAKFHEKAPEQDYVTARRFVQPMIDRADTLAVDRNV